MSLSLTKALSLATASRYTSPAADADILPVVYGDYTAAGGLGGPIPAVLVNTSTYVYVAAAHAVESITDVYIDGVRQSSGFATSTSTDYESQGTVATIDFVSEPSGAVTWRGKGKQSSGSLITNAVTQLEDLLKTYASYVDADIDQTLLAEAKVAADTYQTAFVINDTRTIAAWITEILFNVFGSWRISGSGTLQVLIDEGGTPDPVNVIAHVVAARDCVDGDDGVEMTGDYQHLVNALDVEYGWMWGTSLPAFESTGEEDLLSKNAHGEVRKRIQLRGLRRSADVTTWAGVLWDRQTFGTRVEGAQVRFTTLNARLAHATIGDLIGFSWAWGPEREHGNAYKNQLLKIIEIRHSTANGGRSSVVAIDTGGYIPEDLYFDAANDFDADEWFGGDRDLSVRS